MFCCFLSNLSPRQHPVLGFRGLRPLLRFLENEFPGSDKNQTTLPQCVFGFGIEQGNLSISKWAVTSSFKWNIWLPIGLRLIVDVLGPNPKHDVLVDVLAHQSFKTTRGSVA